MLVNSCCVSRAIGVIEVSDSKNDFQGHSKALEIVPFDKPHTISYYTDDEFWPSEGYGQLKFPAFKNPRWRTAAILKNENRPYLRIGWTDLCEIWYDDAHLASEPDRKLKFPTFKHQDGGRPPFCKNGKSAIKQYLLMRRPVPVKSAIHRVNISRIICYVIYFTYFT